eukprot:tig00020563_g11201.t1
MGLDAAMFVDPSVARDFSCPICHDVLQEPTEANCEGGHVFCFSCISAHFAVRKDGTRCPECNEPITEDQVRKNKKVRNVISDAETSPRPHDIDSCANEAGGCKWRGKQFNREAHIKICPRTSTACCGCATFFSREEIEAHEAACDRVQRTCKNAPFGCEALVAEFDREAHLAVCAQRCRESLQRLKQRAEEAETKQKVAEDQKKAAEDRAGQAEQQADAAKRKAARKEDRAKEAEDDAREYAEQVKQEKARAKAAEDRTQQAVVRAQAAEREKNDARKYANALSEYLELFVSFQASCPNFLDEQRDDPHRKGIAIPRSCVSSDAVGAWCK